MKKWMTALAVTAFLLPFGMAGAEEAAPQQGENAEAHQIDPALTNRKAEYPSPAEVLPPVPQAPAGGLSDPKAFMEYGKALEAYVAAAQKYIDGATNDANDIVNKRNEAVKAANDAVNAYNQFLDANAKK